MNIGKNIVKENRQANDMYRVQEEDLSKIMSRHF